METANHHGNDSEDGWYDWGDDFKDSYSMAMGLFIIPSVCMVGMMGNIFNILVFNKLGLSKTANILLFSLAISDFLIVFAYSNFIKMYFSFGPVSGMPHFIDYFFFILLTLFDIVDASCVSISFNLPVLLTVERLVAVFYADKFSSMVTPRKITIAVAAVYMFGFGATLVFKFIDDDGVYYGNANNVSEELKGRSEFKVQKLSDMGTFDLVFQQLSANLPVSTVMIGCAAIMYKLKKLENEGESSSDSSDKETGNCQTTSTLLTVCGVYVMATMIMFTPGMLLIILSGNIPDSRELTNMGVIIGLFIRLIIVFKAACTAFIYFIVDPRIKEKQMEIINNLRGRNNSK